MKRLPLAALASAAFLFGSAGMAAAQARLPRAASRAERHEQGARPHVGKALLRGVQLTDAQKGQIREINAKYKSQRTEIRDALRADRAKGQRPDSALVRRARDLAEREQSDVRNVLTTDQRSTFDKNVADM